jgi:hypothetical protein
MSRSAASRDGKFRGRPLIPVLFFATPLLTAVAPRLAPFLLLILAIVLIVAVLRRGLAWRALLEPNPAMMALAALAAYAVLSAIWAAEPDEAVSKGLLLLAVTFVVFAVAAAIPSLDAEQIRRAGIAFVAGALCAALFVTIEVLTTGALTRAAMNVIPVLQPDSAKRIKIVDGRVTYIRGAVFNQHVVMLAFQLWPGLLALSTLQSPRRGLLGALFFIALAVPISLSEHDSSQIGLIASALVLLLAWVQSRAAIRGLALAWCLGFALVLPLAFLSYKAELHLTDWLPQSARARIIIWEYTAERVFERPWLGIGADSTPGSKAAPARLERPKGFVQPRTTGHHAHNLFLQTWYELGLVGALLAAIAGAAVVLRILLLPERAQAYGAAAFTMFVAIAAFAFGMWQVWLISAVGLLVVYLLMAAALCRPGAGLK